MPKPKIIAHCIVKNEERFIWYSLQSVLPFVDEVLIYDTGSTDKTVKIIKTIKSDKIHLYKKGEADKNRFSDLRQQMLEKTGDRFDWLMLLDGDEIWPSKSLRKAIKFIQKKSKSQAVFTRMTMAVGDIYHSQPNKAGKYRIANKKGHLNLRFINLKTVPDLHVNLPYGHEGYFSTNDIPVQELPKVFFVNTAYFHASHLKRSSADKDTMMRSGKRKFELGDPIPLAELPEIFFTKHPPFVPDVTQKISTFEKIIFSLLGFFINIKRAFLSS